MFCVYFIRLFSETIIGCPMMMSSWKLLILEMVYRCWVRNQRPTSPSSVKPEPNGWLPRRRALCIISSVRGFLIFCVGERMLFVISISLFRNYILKLIATLSLIRSVLLELRVWGLLCKWNQLWNRLCGRCSWGTGTYSWGPGGLGALLTRPAGLMALLILSGILWWS